MNGIFLLVISFGLVAIISEHNALENSQETALFYKQKYEYYSQGAIDRRYLDLCKNANDEIGFWYKDECKQ